ncbi:hypothetical protein BD410DRAFT_276309 [Rickenella mellea]|uniref:Uncharacterized protein n=1 Tax=Rickenella mellea TaxID=50990 RepID=A0A4Y7Q2Y7_9AGAM|nr:hypothetical protein BD410DRAFT_276309 [Rickenella mellea]
MADAPHSDVEVYSATLVPPSSTGSGSRNRNRNPISHICQPSPLPSVWSLSREHPHLMDSHSFVSLTLPLLIVDSFRSTIKSSVGIWPRSLCPHQTELPQVPLVNVKKMKPNSSASASTSQLQSIPLPGTCAFPFRVVPEARTRLPPHPHPHQVHAPHPNALAWSAREAWVPVAHQ